eukprot:6492187-Amphidinium_carterae.1
METSWHSAARHRCLTRRRWTDSSEWNKEEAFQDHTEGSSEASRCNADSLASRWIPVIRLSSNCSALATACPKLLACSV